MNEQRQQRHLGRMRPRLSAWRDGDLGALRAALVRRHVDRCALCQAEVRALSDVALALATLKQAPPEVDVPPSDDGWLALSRALDASSPMEAAPAAPRRWLRPVLVFSGAGALAAALLIAWTWGRPALLRSQVNEDGMITAAEEQFRRAELSYQRAADDLREIAARHVLTVGPDRARAHKEGLHRLEQALAQRRAEARTRPADALAQQRLYLAYRREIAYLQDSLRPEVASLAGPARSGSAPHPMDLDDETYGFEGGSAP